MFTYHSVAIDIKHVPFNDIIYLVPKNEDIDGMNDFVSVDEKLIIYFVKKLRFALENFAITIALIRVRIHCRSIGNYMEKIVLKL